MDSEVQLPCNLVAQSNYGKVPPCVTTLAFPGIFLFLHAELGI
jgi:hypothetical protein